MDPITIAALVTAFLTAAATSAGGAAGTRVMDLVFKRFESSGKPETLQPFDNAPGEPPEAAREWAQSELAVEIEKDPAFGVQVVEAVNADLSERPGLADSMARMVGRLFDLSPQQEIAQRGTCPVGGERLFIPRYLRPDGTEIKGAAFNPRGFKGLPRSTIAECRQGHKWPVFAIKGS